MKTPSVLREAMSEGSNQSQLSYLLNYATHQKLLEVLSFLLNEYEGREGLFNEFVNSKSDAVSIEVTDVEKLEKDFREWVIVAKS